MGRILGYASSVVVGLLGLLYLLSAASAQNANPTLNFIIGIVLMAIAGAVFLFTYKMAPDTIKRVEVTQKVELAGDTDLERLHCESCGAQLESDSIKVTEDGSVLERDAAIVALPVEDVIEHCRTGAIRDLKTELALRRLAEATERPR